MTRRHILQGLTSAGAAMIISGCSDQYNQTWNQKLTITVRTPAGDKTGSAVLQATSEHGYGLGAGEYKKVNITGEAAVVDLGGGKYLFALLSNSNLPNPAIMTYIADETFLAAGLIKDRKTINYELAHSVGAKAVVPPKFYPMLVTFTNINDPKSVKEVKPDDLTAAIGSGTSIKSITLEITDEKVTEGTVEKVLGWLIGHKFRILSPDIRLGSGLHNASDVLPIEKLTRIDFVENSR